MNVAVNRGDYELTALLPRLAVIGVINLYFFKSRFRRLGAHEKLWEEKRFFFKPFAHGIKCGNDFAVIPQTRINRAFKGILT